MIHEIGRELQAALRAKGCPFNVVDGPEGQATTTYARERIVIEHDEAGDSFGPTRSQSRNPRNRMIRNVGVKITIYAQSSASGALEFEHRRRAEHVLDLVLVALEKVITARHNGWVVKAGRFINPEDLAKSETIGGAVYELSFTVERGVFDTTFTNAARPEFTMGAGGISSTTRAMRPGADEADAEIACGS